MPTDDAFAPNWAAARWGSRGGDARGIAMRAADAALGDDTPVAFAVLEGVFAEVAHALGNPLTGLTLSLERLQHIGREEKVVRAAARIEQAAARLGALKALWGELGAGASQVAPEPIDPAAIASWAESRPHVPTRALRVTIAPGCERMAGSMAPLLWALGELLDNAERHGTGALGLDMAPIERGVRIAVRQEGPVLAPGLLERLWRAPLPQARGTALGTGLLQVAFIAEGLHHGQVAYVPGILGGAMMMLDVPTRS